MSRSRRPPKWPRKCIQCDCWICTPGAVKMRKLRERANGPVEFCLAEIRYDDLCESMPIDADEGDWDDALALGGCA